MSGLRDKASRIQFANLPQAATEVVRKSDEPVDARRPKTAPGALMAAAVEQRSALVQENERLAGELDALRSDAAATRAENERLGVQLQEVLHDIAEWDGAKAVRRISTELVARSRWANRDPRGFAGPEFEQLVAEIQSAGGNVQPIKVRPLGATTGSQRFELVFGHRRFEACCRLGLPVTALIDDVDDQTLFIEMERENRLRKNLSPWEQGVMYRKALDDGLWPSNKQMAAALGVDAGTLGRALALADLPREVLEAFPSPLVLQFRWATPLRQALDADRAGVIARAIEVRNRGSVMSGEETVRALIQSTATRADETEASAIERTVSVAPGVSCTFRRSERDGIKVQISGPRAHRLGMADVETRITDLLRELVVEI